MSEQAFLATLGFERINKYGTMMLDLGGGMMMIMDLGGKMNAKAKAAQADLLMLRELDEITDRWLLGLPVPDQLQLSMLSYVAQELAAADLDAAMLKAKQPAGTPDLMTLMGMPNGTPTIGNDDQADISAGRTAELFGGNRPRREHLCELAT